MEDGAKATKESCIMKFNALNMLHTMISRMIHSIDMGNILHIDQCIRNIRHDHKSSRF